MSNTFLIYQNPQSTCDEKKSKMKFLEAILSIHCFILIHSSGQYLPSSSYFIKQGNISEATDLCVYAVHTREIKSLVECALHCGMSLLCKAFEFCFLGGLYTCRFRYGHANISNTTTQCELHEITTVSTNLLLRHLNF